MTACTKSSKVGGASKFTEDLAREICNWIAEGLSIREVCRLRGMPDRKTVYRWRLADGPEFDHFRTQYDEATKIRAEHVFDEVIAIADQCSDESGPATSKARLQCDIRRWALARMDPSRYGDRSKVELAGDPKAPLHADVRDKKDIGQDLFRFTSEKDREFIGQAARDSLQCGGLENLTSETLERLADITTRVNLLAAATRDVESPDPRSG